MATASGIDAMLEVWHPVPRYDRWLETLAVPIHRGYHVEDLRTVAVGPWEERACNAAILVLAGQEGVTETRVTEIPPGATLPALKFSLDEIVYVLEGRGLTTVWAEGRAKKSFEWQTHSLFILPRNYIHQLTNMQGNQPARILNFNYLPVALAVFQDPKYFFNNPYTLPDLDVLYNPAEESFYSQAKYAQLGKSWGAFWVGNFFPDVTAWDKMRAVEGRGAGASSASFAFPGTGMRVAIPTMPVGTYKKGHRHGPGISIVIPGAADGYSIMWPEGGEKVIVPWHEGSLFIPPNMWYHQHFNVGATPARYMPLHTPRHPLFGGQRGERAVGNQIEYPDEERWIRERFEAELAKRSLKSLMPEACYVDREFVWDSERTED